MLAGSICYVRYQCSAKDAEKVIDNLL